MFASINQTPKPTFYKPNVVPKQDVTFRPLKNESGNLQYIALMETDETLIINEEDRTENSEFSELYDKKEIYVPLEATSPPPSTDPFSLGNDPIKLFYVGSVTVVGLFILYRILNKKM